MISEKAYLSGTEELAGLKGAFMRYDPEGSGFIRSADVELALRDMRRDPTHAVNILREFDPEGTGPVDFEQFIRITAAATGACAAPYIYISLRPPCRTRSSAIATVLHPHYALTHSRTRTHTRLRFAPRPPSPSLRRRPARLSP